MKFAPIVPINYLEELASLSDYQLCLAHLVLLNKTYGSFYRRCKEEGKFLILDNGACELGRSVPVDLLLESFIEIGTSDVVVIPDAPRSGDNIRLFKEFEKSYEMFLKENPATKFMAIPHSLSEVDLMVNSNFVSFIGLARDDFDRLKVIEKFKDSGKKFHILGLRKDPIYEVAELRAYENYVIGIDSSLPYRILRLGRTLSEVSPFPKPIDFYEDNLGSNLLNHCKVGLLWYIKWVESL